MTTKIRYNVHTSNKYSVFDSEASEDDIGIKNKVKNKNTREMNRGKSNEEKKSNMNSAEISNYSDIRNAIPTPKPVGEKKFLTSLNDREKHIIPSLNDVVNERAYRTYRENLLNKKNEKKKNMKIPIGNNSTVATSTNGVTTNSYYKGSRNFDYKGNTERRPFNSSYRHEKYDYRERTLDYDDTSPRYDKPRRNGYEYRNRGAYYESVRKAREQDSITIDFDMYKKQQEKKMSSNSRNINSVDSRKKEMSADKSDQVESNTRRKETEEEHKVEQPKKKVLNMYQFISEERRKNDRMPSFFKSYRGYRRGGVGSAIGENRYRSFNNKPKITIDENILKNRDPPNIYDTRAFPSLTASK